MRHKSLLFRFVALVAAMMCALGASADLAYACYTPENTTLTFYYDINQSTRPGTTYNLNADFTEPGWVLDGTNANVTKVVFFPTFADARPTSTFEWFSGMQNLQTFTGLTNLNTSMVTNMSLMFANCKSLTSLDLSSFNTSKVTTMAGMFSHCTSLTSLDLSSFKTTNVTTMSTMFYNCNSLHTIYVGNDWTVAAVGYSDNMFKNCTSLVGGMGTTYDANHLDKAYAHIDGGTSNPGYFTDKNAIEAYANYIPGDGTLTFYYDNQRSSRPNATYDLNTGSNVPDWCNEAVLTYTTRVIFDPSFAAARPTSTYKWFFGMRNLQSFTGLSNLNTSEVTNMNYMFSHCSKLTSLDLSSFNTSKVTSMENMFYYCSDLTSLKLSSFNTALVTIMEHMFAYCSNLKTIYVDNEWSTSAVTTSTEMFVGCSNLVGGQGTTYDVYHTDASYAHIDGGPSDPGYLTSNIQAYACYTWDFNVLTFYYDDMRAYRMGRTYNLNTVGNKPSWYTDGT